MPSPPPDLFPRYVDAVRRLFLHNVTLTVRFTDLARQAQIPSSACAAAVAVLINQNFLAWRGETLCRADAPIEQPKRRTA